MRHRKKFLAAFLLLAAAYATVCFWPHSNPEAVRALEAMRGMIEVDDGANRFPPVAAKHSENIQVDLQIMIAMVNLTDATVGLFAKPGRIGDKAVIGRMNTDRLGLVESVRSNAATRVLSMPNVITISGRQASVVSGDSFPVITLAPAGGSNVQPIVNYRDVGTTFRVTPLVTSAGTLTLELDCELSQVRGGKTVVSPQGPIQIGNVHSLAFKTCAQLRAGETLVLGGLSLKRPDRVLFKLPAVSEIPGIGSWFQFSREREIEEELIILVTPRIVTPVAAK